MALSFLTTTNIILKHLSLESDVYLQWKQPLNDTGSTQKEKKSNIALLESETIIKRPPMFRVIMLNDDYTPMDFVVDVLKNIFHISHEDAISIMLQIHHQGAASCGVFTRDVAETKIELAANFAKQYEYPLQCVLEMS